MVKLRHPTIRLRLKDAVKVFKVNLKVENGMSSNQSVYCAHLKVPRGIIQDVKFVDDENVMLAIVDDCESIRVHLVVARSSILTRIQHLHT